jgi:hypothetical protein
VPDPVSVARVLGAVVLVALAAGALPAVAAGGASRVVGDCDRSQVRPATIWISCNNPSFSFAALHWRRFGASVARAVGVMRLESCPSSCDSRDVARYPVTLVLSHPRPCPDGRRDYRRAAVTFSSPARPAGNTATTTELALFCPLTN